MVYCTCGRCLRISRSEKEVDKSNNDVVSIPGNVIKKNNLLNDNECITRLKKYIKAGQKKHGEHSSILARWNSDYKNRNSLTRIVNGLSRTSCYLTELPRKNQSFFATKAERIRNSEH